LRLDNAVCAKSFPPLKITVEVSIGVIEDQSSATCIGVVRAERSLEVCQLVAP
jgi:hypothetical protein